MPGATTSSTSPAPSSRSSTPSTSATESGTCSRSRRRTRPRTYTCPGCGLEISSGVAHTVTWRADGLMGEADDLAGRRHWHTPLLEDPPVSDGDGAIRSSTELPARRTDIQLHTSDGLTLVGELALPSRGRPGRDARVPAPAADARRVHGLAHHPQGRCPTARACGSRRAAVQLPWGGIAARHVRRAPSARVSTSGSTSRRRCGSSWSSGCRIPGSSVGRSAPRSFSSTDWTRSIWTMAWMARCSSPRPCTARQPTSSPHGLAAASASSWWCRSSTTTCAPPRPPSDSRSCQRRS